MFLNVRACVARAVACRGKSPSPSTVQPQPQPRSCGEYGPMGLLLKGPYGPWERRRKVKVQVGEKTEPPDATSTSPCASICLCPQAEAPSVNCGTCSCSCSYIHIYKVAQREVPCGCGCYSSAAASNLQPGLCTTPLLQPQFPAPCVFLFFAFALLFTCVCVCVCVCVIVQKQKRTTPNAATPCAPGLGLCCLFWFRLPVYIQAPCLSFWGLCVCSAMAAATLHFPCVYLHANVASHQAADIFCEQRCHLPALSTGTQPP
jgi:hypothetical protein